MAAIVSQRVSYPLPAALDEGGAAVPPTPKLTARQQRARRAAVDACGVPNSKVAGAGGVTLEIHNAQRQRKYVEAHAQAIQRRIAFMARTENKVWREVEETRRCAEIVERGRATRHQSFIHQQTIDQQKRQAFQENQEKAEGSRYNRLTGIGHKTYEALSRRHTEALQQKADSCKMLMTVRKQALEAHQRKSVQVLARHQEQADARTKASNDRFQMLARNARERAIVHQQEVDRTQEFLMEARLPELEEEEMRCLERLRNSREVTRNALQHVRRSLSATRYVSSRPSLSSSLSLLDTTSPRSPLSARGVSVGSGPPSPVMGDSATARGPSSPGLAELPELSEVSEVAEVSEQHEGARLLISVGMARGLRSNTPLTVTEPFCSCSLTLADGQLTPQFSTDVATVHESGELAWGCSAEVMVNSTQLEALVFEVLDRLPDGSTALLGKATVSVSDVFRYQRGFESDLRLQGGECHSGRLSVAVEVPPEDTGS